MLVSHSPPVFSHSPPAGFLSEYSSLRLNREAFSIFQRNSTCRGSVSITYNMAPATVSPKRPCLVIRPNEEASSSGDEDPTSPTRLKKKVVFADDKGMSLTHVRVMTEPSNVPPLWSTRFLAEVTRGVSAEPEARADPWLIKFPQPASDYLAFRNKLETNKVSLENVIVKESEDQVVGTVKVANLAFEKEVIVRTTYDSWKTHEDVFCTFVPNSLNASVSSAYVLYDTFSFKINIQPKARKMEFCVCYRCNDTEYWDNNDGKNYVLIKSTITPLHRSLSNDEIYNRRENVSQPKEIPQKYSDLSKTKMDAWTQFASWNHLENTTPYCVY